MLCVLAEKPRGMAELARLFGVGKANLTGLVDRAAQRHLVERSLVPGDRRAVQVVLTEDGRRSALAFHQNVVEELDRLLAPLTPAVSRRIPGKRRRHRQGGRPPRHLTSPPDLLTARRRLGAPRTQSPSEGGYHSPAFDRSHVS